MNNLLAIEWLKIRRYRVFWVMIGIFGVLLPFWNYQISKGIVQAGPEGMNFLSNAYTFPEVWSNFGWWGSIFVLFLAILVITLTCNEFTFRTHRQNVIDGWSRLDFFHAKVALVAFISVCTTLFVFALGLIFGLCYSGSMSGMFEGLEKMGFFFLLLLNYLGAALFLALWLRRSGLTIALFLFYSIIIDYSFAATINRITGTKYGNFMPLQSSDELLPFPLMKLATQMLSQSAPIPNYAYVIVSCCWILLYYLVGRLMILKRDL